MKTNAIIRIVLFSLTIIILLGILTTALLAHQYTFDPRFDYHHEFSPTEPVQQITTENVTADIRNIEIEWVAGIITLQADQNATYISIIEHSSSDSEHKMVCKQSGQTLKIQFSEESFEFPSFGVNADIRKDLVITVPADWECNSLEIDAAAAQVIMNGPSIHEFDFDGASGSCSMINCDITNIDIDTASGDIDFSGTLDTLDCDAASANCSIEVFNIPSSIKMDGASGDLELILPTNTGFTCNMDTMSGTFETDFETGVHDGAYIHGDGACQIKVSAMSGDVSILKGIE